jgi:Flp pilus assembly pilin Flp
MPNFSMLLTQLHQDEYALLGALTALSAVSRLKFVANGVAGIFTALGSTITPNI